MRDDGGMPNYQAPPTEEEIRTLAQQIWRSRQLNGVQGDAESDWFAAERQLSEDAVLPIGQSASA
jgi:hypothetical protein